MPTCLEKWVEEQARLTKPKKIYWCNGTPEETQKLIETGINEEKINGHPVFYELNHQLWPSSYLHRSHPQDVARTEHLTFICCDDSRNAGPNNNWMKPQDAKEKLTRLFDGCMRGRTMYVLPYIMGHPRSPYSKACVQLTDSVYVAVNMGIMTRMGRNALGILNKINDVEKIVKGLHSIHELDPERRFIMHFPDENLVWSVGSGYGGNALLGKKCFSLRIASFLGLNEWWLAEHMTIFGVEDPDGEITYIAGAFPSACGKTNLAMLKSALPEYKIWTLGDDIAWLHKGSDGRLWAMNPETGFFGVAPGTSLKTNANMIHTLKNTIVSPTLFTNTGLNTATNTPWWEGLGEPPQNLLDWQGNQWNSSFGKPIAHPNSRLTVSIYNCPVVSPEFDNPKGVPISAIIFGGKRTQLIPLVVEAFDWQHGVFLGARSGSETTAAATGQTNVVRRDPMAMLPFCGYNMADYFGHWLSFGYKLQNPPKIFSVNWFRTNEEGKFLWPGFGENIRILKWIIDRTKNRVQAKETPLGLMPHIQDLDTRGLEISDDAFKKLFEIKSSEWTKEIEEVAEFFRKFGSRMPTGMKNELQAMKRKLKIK